MEVESFEAKQICETPWRMECWVLNCCLRATVLCDGSPRQRPRGMDPGWRIQPLLPARCWRSQNYKPRKTISRTSQNAMQQDLFGWEGYTLKSWPIQSIFNAFMCDFWHFLGLFISQPFCFFPPFGLLWARVIVHAASRRGWSWRAGFWRWQDWTKKLLGCAVLSVSSSETQVHV